MEYDAAGRLTKRTDPNGVVMTYSYDNVNRVLDVAANRGTTPIADYAYTRDTIGRVTTLTELGGRTATYGYSVPGRLINETITGEPHGINGSIVYTHDSVGNRLTRTSSVGPVAGQAFAYDANDRITTETYDANGNTLVAEGDAFGYDFEDRLVAINGSVGISYDADGMIASRTEGAVNTSYLVDDRNPTGYSQVVEEVVAGAVSKTFVYGRGPLRSGGQSFVADGHTDVRLLTDGSGAITDQYDFEGFGVGTRTSGVSVNPLRYTGERGESAGLTFLRARHMRNGTGRFTSVDTASGNVQQGRTLHRYTYGSGEPVMYIDPSGHDFSLAGLSVGILSAGLLMVPGDIALFKPQGKYLRTSVSGSALNNLSVALWGPYFDRWGLDLSSVQISFLDKLTGKDPLGVAEAPMFTTGFNVLNSYWAGASEPERKKTICHELVHLAQFQIAIKRDIRDQVTERFDTEWSNPLKYVPTQTLEGQSLDQVDILSPGAVAPSGGGGNSGGSFVGFTLESIAEYVAGKLPG